MTTILEPAELPGLRHALVVPLSNLEWRQAENGRSEDYTIRGHAAVFNKLSEDLGGFRELLEPGAFRAALRSQPDVRLLYGHNGDSLFPLARTKSGTLELREDSTGLHVWAKVAPTTFASDLRMAMQRGDVDQMSFAFSLADGGDDWAVTDDGTIVRTIRADGINGLYDVSVVTYPAYSQTEVAMRELRSAVDRGRLPSHLFGEPAQNNTAAPLVAGEESRSHEAGDTFVLERERIRRQRARLGITNSKEID